MEGTDRPRIATVQEYYADPRVRQRIYEYCGDTGSGAMTCAYLTGLTGTESPLVTWGRAPRYPASNLDSLIQTLAIAGDKIYN